MAESLKFPKSWILEIHILKVPLSQRKYYNFER